MTADREQVRRDAEQMTVAEAVAELQRLEGQQATIEHALGEPTRRGEALRVVLADLESSEQREAALVEALREAVEWFKQHGYEVGNDEPLTSWWEALTVYEQSQGNG